jgi:hypothetical protein
VRFPFSFHLTQNGTYIAKSVALLPLSSFLIHISCTLHTPMFYKKLATSNQTKETTEWYSTSLGIRTPVFRKQLGLIYGIRKGLTLQGIKTISINRKDHQHIDYGK